MKTGKVIMRTSEERLRITQNHLRGYIQRLQEDDIQGEIDFVYILKKILRASEE